MQYKKKSVFSERRYINTIASTIHFLKIQHLKEFESLSVYKKQQKKNVKDVNLVVVPLCFFSQRKLRICVLFRCGLSVQNGVETKGL